MPCLVEASQHLFSKNIVEIFAHFASYAVKMQLNRKRRKEREGEEHAMSLIIHYLLGFTDTMINKPTSTSKPSQIATDFKLQQ